MLSSSSAGGGEQLCRVTEVEAGKLICSSFASGSLDTPRSLGGSCQRAPGRGVFLEFACFDPDSPIGRQAHDGMGARWPNVHTRIEWILPDYLDRRSDSRTPDMGKSDSLKIKGKAVIR